MIEGGFLYAGVGLTLSVLGVLASFVFPGIDRQNKRFFAVFFSLMVLWMLNLLLEMLYAMHQADARVLKAFYYVESLIPLFLFLMLTAYLLHCVGENWKKSGIFWIVAVLGGVFFVQLTATQFAPIFYWVTPDNQLLLGSWYPLSVAPIFLILLLDVSLVIRRRDRLSRKYYLGFLVCLLPLTLAVLVHLFAAYFPLVYIGLAVTAFAMYGLIQVDQIQQQLRQQREIAQQKASIMVLQMRPHFIYNTMTSIYCLCNQDPQKARQVTLDFTTYLRKNFTAIACEDTISFPEELEHTRAYLAVEQAQFEDSLFLEFDTPHTQFRLPPLTLQPIVENAVKHGLDPESDSLHLVIRTRETKLGSEILVEDDGTGYEAPDDSQPHIALANIRQRLELMCGGRLTIRPREGGGTVVQVIIPRRAGNRGREDLL